MSAFRLRRIVRGIALIFVAILGTACRDAASPTAPSTTPTVSLATVDTDVPDEPIEDVVNRVLPALVDEESAEQLYLTFQALLSTMSSGPMSAVPAALDRAERAVERYGDVTSAAKDDAVHLDVMAAALTTVRDALKTR